MIERNDDTEDERLRRRRRAELERAQRRRRLLACAIGLAAVATVGIAGISGLSGDESTTTASAQKQKVPREQRAREAAERADAAVDKTLAYTPYISHGTRLRKRVALTFDDGPGEQTGQILDVLDRFGARGTFFNLGTEVRAQPRLTALSRARGNAIGDHTYDHPRLAGLPVAEQAAQIDIARNELHRAGGGDPRLFRPPYGSFDDTTLKLLRQRRMLMVLWSIDATDFGDATADGIAERVLSQVEPGAIVLMHDGGGDRTPTLGALPAVLKGLKSRGYDVVTVPELLETNPPRHDQPPPTPLDGL